MVIKDITIFIKILTENSSKLLRNALILNHYLTCKPSLSRNIKRKSTLKNLNIAETEIEDKKYSIVNLNNKLFVFDKCVIIILILNKWHLK